jgi:hypothetical protein
MATGNDEGSHTLSERIACLPKGRPRVYAGPGKGATRCDACGSNIPVAATEYEIVFEAISFRFDRTCFAMWQSELGKN